MIAKVTSHEFSRSFFAEGRPAVITDALDEWRIGERWMPEHLVDAAKHRRITTSRSGDGRYRFDPSREGASSNAFETSETTFGEAVRHLLDPDAGDHLYVMQQSIPEKLPELLDHVVLPRWIGDERPAINLWFGRGTTTQLHFDYSNNFFAQLHGEKTFTIFAPNDSERLYPYDHDSATAHLSHVELDQPNLAHHPDFSSASPIRFTLQPGDLLFLPAFWWHHVRSPEVSISVNFWWAPELKQILDAPNSTRALPNFYAIDRLMSFQQAFLAPAGLDFLTAAAMFLRHGRTWAACLLTLAAFDEWAATPDGDGGAAPAQRPGCRLNALPDALLALADLALAERGEAVGHRDLVALAVSLAEIVARHYGDARVDGDHVLTLMRGVERLRAKPARTTEDSLS